MKKINALTVVLLSITFIACQKKEEQKTNSASTEKVATETQTPQKVSLNNGQPWEANPETTSGIKALQALILASNQGESAAVLKEKLNVEFTIIFKKCTMTGEAHDQLHNYLLPLKHKINAIEEANKKPMQQEIASYLEQYTLYFK